MPDRLQWLSMHQKWGVHSLRDASILYNVELYLELLSHLSNYIILFSWSSFSSIKRLYKKTVISDFWALRHLASNHPCGQWVAFPPPSFKNFCLKKLIRGPVFSGYVRVCIWVCLLYGYRYKYVCAHIWHMKASLGDVHLALCLLRGTGSLIGLELINSAGLASQWATGLSFSISPQSSDYKKASSCPVFHMDSGWSDSRSQASRESALVTEPSPSHS